MRRNQANLLLCLAAVVLLGGCVERRFLVNSEPAGARIILDGEEVGKTPMTIDFTYYGTREIVLKKEGYETHRDFAEIDTPLYQEFPIDFFADLLYPGTIVDERTFSYTLKKAAPYSEEELLERARTAREQGKATDPKDSE